MDKVEFSDAYKFVASIGLIAIGLSILVPWFLNKENEIVLVEAKKILALTPTAQKIVNQQQSNLLLLNNHLILISCILVSIGISLLGWSIFQWNKRQRVTDRIQDEELKSKVISNMTDQQKRHSVAVEIMENELIDSSMDSINVGDSPVDVPTPISTPVDNTVYEPTLSVTSGEVSINDRIAHENEIDSYLKIENQIYAKLSSLTSHGYQAYQNIKLNLIELDVLLKANDIIRRDLIFEIKIYKGNLRRTAVKMAAVRLTDYCKQYDIIYKASPCGILIIVHSGLDTQSYMKEMKNEVKKIGKDRGQNLDVKYIDVNRISEFDPSLILA